MSIFMLKTFLKDLQLFTKLRFPSGKDSLIAGFTLGLSIWIDVLVYVVRTITIILISVLIKSKYHLIKSNRMISFFLSNRVKILFEVKVSHGKIKNEALNILYEFRNCVTLNIKELGTDTWIIY